MRGRGLGLWWVSCADGGLGRGRLPSKIASPTQRKTALRKRFWSMVGVMEYVFEMVRALASPSWDLMLERKAEGVMSA